jgi:2-methylcitrate dehydratase PrpD
MAIITPGVVPASVLVTGKTPKWVRQWASFARRSSFGDLPPAVVERARLVMLDSFGAIIAGQREPEVQAAARRLAKTARARKAGSPLTASFLDGLAGTFLEIDEGNQFARGHPAIHVVPALMAASRLRRVTGRDAALALALGYEIGARIGIASKLRVTMHPHGTWGTVGAAMGVAKLNRASAAEFAGVISVASSLGLTTSRRTMLEGATIRNSYAGFSNMLGMMAWDLVKAGITGEADGVGSVYGGIAADDWRPAEMVDGLGERWEIARNYFKRHAACRYNHGALDALSEIVGRAGGRIDPDMVERIDVETYVWAAQLDHQQPANMLAAKFSTPFSLATFIAHGKADLDAFREPARANPAVQSLAKRVFVTEDPALTAKLPGLRPAQVRVRLKDGRSFDALAQTNRGDTEDPYSTADVVAKFHEVAGPSLGAERAAELAARVLSLDEEPDFASLQALCDP